MDIREPPAAIEIGAVIADTYRVVEKLGEGGMGLVVKATHVVTGEHVAIKLIRPEVASAEALSRFEREARAATTLKSENVCRASAVGKLPNGAPYLVMEYLEGEDVGHLLERRGRLSIRESIDIILQICNAMSEAHAAGIIHRDLKPKNIFVTQRPEGGSLVKVLDFGISKIEDAEDLHLTRTTEIIGSPSYMSPEQLRASRDVDYRTDIWALGVILYELLTNEIPFQAEVVTQLVAIVLMEKEPSVRSLRREVPSGVEKIIERCLAKKAADRFQGVAELGYALAPFKDAAELELPRFGETALILPAPAAPTSSRVMVHGGTSVAWGDTQMDVTAKRRGRWPAFAVAVGALLTVGLTATTGAVIYSRRADAAGPPPPVAGADFAPLPPSRKDLPPLDPSVAQIPTTPPTDSVDLTDPVKVETTINRLPRTPTQNPRLGAKPGGDPLANIGRR